MELRTRQRARHCYLFFPCWSADVVRQEVAICHPVYSGVLLNHKTGIITGLPFSILPMVPKIFWGFAQCTLFTCFDTVVKLLVLEFDIFPTRSVQHTVPYFRHFLEARSDLLIIQFLPPDFNCILMSCQ